MSLEDQDTENFELGPRQTSKYFADEFTPSRIDVAGGSHAGLKRSENQDHFAVVRRARIQQVVISDVDLDATCATEDANYLLIVADGMGGEAFGEVASRTVIQTAWELMHKATSWAMKLTNLSTDEQQKRASEYVTLLEQRLRERVEQNPSMQGMGTTMTVVNIMGLDAVVSHIGDTRAYRFREGQLTRLTQDQTVEQSLLDKGVPPSEAARFHNVLTNCLGSHRTGTSAEVTLVSLQHGDRILVCTDGLTNELNDEEIIPLMGHDRSPQESCDALIQAALDKGGRDNVTVIVAQVEALKGIHQSSAAFL